MAQSSSSKVPQLLQPVIESLAQDSLHLLTEVTGTSNTWLATRYIAGFLSHQSRPLASTQNETLGAKASKPRAVLLLSFLRTLEFWKLDAKRACVRVSLESRVH
jgi:hypothetical protein